MTHVKCLRCRECKSEYPIEPLNACEFCFGPLEVAYDYEAISKTVSRKSIESGPDTMWRYHDFLPVEKESAVDISTGFTPLIHAKNLGHQLGLNHLYIKNDSVNPTFSFKDRPVSVTTTKALEFEFDVLACVSTGNLMGSVAAHGAKAGMKTMVFYPAYLEQGKILGAAVYGPTMVAVDGTYDQANRFCSELADNHRWAFVNINMRPYYAEGSKTLGYEVAEQLGWKAPDHCVVPGASGELHTKIWKGLQEFEDAGLIGKVKTRMHLAQAEGCSPIVQAFEQGSNQVVPVRPETIAKSLAIGNPAAGPYSLEVLRETNGTGIAALENTIIDGIRLLAETEGIFTETAGGVVISSLKRLVEQGKIGKEEVTVAYITGNGLKTMEAMGDFVQPVETTPDYETFHTALADSQGRL
ncbi:MAG: threonine synthase [SAR202 cluster bacterium]|nr:threonine synthase [SAR202 cluster bacterium]HAE33220.1 threonine synthase [Dehalococcoidia bacterium]